MADGVGFEPTEPLSSTVFKTAALNHSATHPFHRIGGGGGIRTHTGIAPFGRLATGCLNLIQPPHPSVLELSADRPLWLFMTHPLSCGKGIKKSTKASQYLIRRALASLVLAFCRVPYLMQDQKIVALDVRNNSVTPAMPLQALSHGQHAPTAH